MVCCFPSVRQHSFIEQYNIAYFKRSSLWNSRNEPQRGFWKHKKFPGGVDVDYCRLLFLGASLLRYKQIKLRDTVIFQQSKNDFNSTAKWKQNFGICNGFCYIRLQFSFAICDVNSFKDIVKTRFSLWVNMKQD